MAAEGGFRFEVAPLKQDETLEWPNVDPVEIVCVLDPNNRVHLPNPNFERGFIGVDERGNIQTFLHRWRREKLSNGESRLVKVLIHQGGPQGFDSIEDPMRQYVRIIKRYIGIKVKLEDGEDVLQPPLGLRDFAEELHRTEDSITIPGHKDWVRSLGSLIDQATRDITFSKDPTVLNARLEPLQEMSERLNKSTNPYLKNAGSDLEEVIASDDRFRKLAALQRAGGSALDRMREIDQITISLMRRYRRLEVHRGNSETVVRRLALKVFRSSARWQHEEEQRQKIANSFSRDSLIELDQLITNPFKERAKRLRPLNYLNSTFETAGPGSVERVIEKAVYELDMWKEEVDAAIKGRFQDRYPVSI